MSEKNKSKPRIKSAPGLFDSAPGETKRQKEIRHEIGVMTFIWWLQSIAKNEAERKAIADWKTNYEQALFGKLRHSEKKRTSFEFLRRWHNARLYQRESTEPEEMAPMPMRLVFLAPLVEALDVLDVEFFEGLAKAVRTLNDRIYYNAERPGYVGRDTFLNKWLLEYKMEIWPKAKHTVRELNEERVSKFRSIKDKKLHERLHQLDVPHKDQPRGKASPKYGNVLNLPPKRRKSGKF
jgi:hypothetical protein